MTSASDVTSFHVSSRGMIYGYRHSRLLTVWAMGSLVSVQLRRDIHHSFLIRSSEKVLCDNRHSIRRTSSIRKGVKKALYVVIILLRFQTVQMATARPVITAGLESSHLLVVIT
ncbi:hypothetical protein AVEN_89253-1 [Araneus ventricosus]|uniref:Uncharacterized protein n=1 Tax=Araneus ventricosus TaxID=182803 RepID=A0A4Y2RGD8_ARAVE|nr:hypothetical protein AVEN_89253-1 [Araneus ventricosus]